MSFRKRGHVLGGREPSVRAVPGRSLNGDVINARSMGAQLSEGRPTPRSGPMNNLRSSDRNPSHLTPPIGRMQKLNIDGASNGESFGSAGGLDKNHPGIRPSPASSQQTTSTGSSHLDKVLGHMGLPLGNSMLVEEQGTTEFSSVLCKLFASQGVMHNRAENSTNHSENTHLCIISCNQGFSKELPGVYKGSSKDIKKNAIAEKQSKVTVQNLAEQSNPSRYKDLKIAWRYKLGDEKEGPQASTGNNNASENEYKYYNQQFDITTRLMPAPLSSEISFVSPQQPIQRILSQTEQIIRKHENKLLRIVIPSLLHPAMYPPQFFRLPGIMPLLHGLKSLVKKYEDRCVLMVSISSDLLNEFFLAQIEALFDSVINLEPFNQEMLQFLERAYKSQPNKVQHGLLHISKLPVFSDRGEMHVMRSHYAFKNSRRKFEIEEWGIPVADVDDANKDSTKNVAHAHSDPLKGSNEPHQSTNISIDF